jgi:hypothetical protein
MRQAWRRSAFARSRANRRGTRGDSPWTFEPAVGQLALLESMPCLPQRSLLS